MGYGYRGSRSFTAYTRSAGGNRFRKTYRKKKWYGRKKFKKVGKPTVAIARGPNILPDRYMCKLVYTNSVVGASVVAGGYQRTYRGNSINNVDTATAATHPIGWTDMMALYQYFRVLACKCVLTFTNTSGTQTAATQSTDIVLWPTFDDAATSSYLCDIAAGNPYAVRRVGDVTNVGSVTIKSYMTTKKIAGVTGRQVMDEDNYSQTFGTGNPTDQWYWNVIMQPSDRATTQTYTITAKITYYCVMESRQLQNN